MITFDKNNPEEIPEVPPEVAVCQICGSRLVIVDIDEWWEGNEDEDDGRVTDAGLHINCVTEPDIDSDEWWEWHKWHWSMPYVDWLPVSQVVYRWFDKHYRIKV